MSITFGRNSMTSSLSYSTEINDKTRAAVRRCTQSVIALLVWLGLMASFGKAQTAQFTQNSPSTNTITLQVPLASYPGRGASLPVSLYYSSKVWRIGFINSVHSSPGVVRSVAEAIYAEYSSAGWTTSLDVPKVEWPKANDVYWFDGKAYPRGVIGTSTYRVARVFIHMPDGSTHELRESDQAYPATNGIDMTGTFWSVDGSRMRYDSVNETTGTLYLPDGTRYILNSGSAQFIDRNGNTLNYDGTTRQWRDTLNREIGMPFPANPTAGDYPYLLPGLGGSNTTYTFKWRHLSEALSQGQGLKCAGDYFLPAPGQLPTPFNGFNFPQQTGAASLFQSGYSTDIVLEEGQQENLFTYVVGRGQVGGNIFNPVVLSEIVLPNGLSYKLTYNSYGEIDKVIYPTGAYQRYEHSQIAPLTRMAIPFNRGSRGVTSRWVSPNGTGGADESQWVYQAERLSTSYRVSETAPNGTRTETFLHTSNSTQNTSFGHEDARIGQPIEERVYASASEGGAMLRRSLTEYGSTTATFTRPSPGSGTYTAFRNPRPQKNVSLMLDTGGNALASTTTSQYDGTFQFTVGLDLIQTADYSFTTVDQTTAQTGAITAIPLGSLLRTNETAFLTSNANYRNRNILGLVTSTVVKNAAGAIVSQSTLSYDEPAYPLIQNGSVPQWTDPLTNFRGNVTTVSRWLDFPIATWISTHTEYDQCGSVVNTLDAKGNLSQIVYSPAFAFAYPTQTTSAVPDPTGTYGSTASLTASTSYDFNTGLVISATDANSNTTTFEYNDPLNRVTKVNHPDGGSTITNYDDTVGSAHVHTQTLQQTSPTVQMLETFQFFDKMGRSVRSFVDEGATYLTSDTQYDNLGRVLRVSNPYRTSAFTDPVNPSDQWTTNSYDSLSRLINVTMPGGAQTLTAYSAVTTGNYIGPSVTVTDPAGKARKSISDAQGRAIQVIEDPNGLAYQTNYTYDVLDKLRKVEQGSQLRCFSYDSLSRLVRVRNVEQAINNALNRTDPVTGYAGGWTLGMSYDENGNISTRVDARNVVTTYGYDALNRNTTVDYSDSTPDSFRRYDFAVNGKGRINQTWQTGTTASATYIDSYDTVGRPKIQRQRFETSGVWSASYQTECAYNLAGAVTSQTYPSGSTVSYTYDPAGRTASFAGNLGDGANGASRTYSTGIIYSPFGGMAKEQFDTDIPIYNKSFYNSRGQLSEIRVSTSYTGPTDTDWNRGAIINHYSNLCWGACSGNMTDNNGSLKQQDHWIPDSNGGVQALFIQNYDYDSLNRLQRVREGTSWQQEYVYDRWGNRTIHQANTSPGISKPDFGVDETTNRLTAPAGFTMSYDAAGNLTNDTFTGQGQRVYDAENHLTQAWANGQWQIYTYDGSGERVRRKVNGVETWQVYGFGGELLAEYAANGSVANPQKEYGYRNGQLLIVATGGTGWGSPPTLNDNPLVVAQTTTQARHITELRAAIDALRSNLGMSAYSWQQSAAAGGFIKANPIVEMRTALDQALGAPPAGYSSGLTQGLVIRAIHIQELRDRVLAAWSAASSVQIKWLVTDHLGTPRMTLDKTGSLAGVKRHDYLPFGEELLAGGRTSTPGYGAADGVRQKFTGYEADDETGLNFAQARYQSSAQGRFTSVDPLGRSANIVNPQSFNRYTYVLNNPTNFTDPDGLMAADASIGWSNVSGGFWGSSFDFGGPPAQNHIAEAMERHDRYMWNDMNGGEYGEEVVVPEDPQPNPFRPGVCYLKSPQAQSSTPQSAEEYLAEALRTLAKELQANSDTLPNDGEQIVDSVVDGALGGPQDLVQSIYHSTMQEYRAERRPVNRFYEKYKIYLVMAKKEFAAKKEATKHANAMGPLQGPIGNIIVKTKHFGTFALRPYDVITQTILNESVVERRGRIPMDKVQRFTRGTDGKLRPR